MSTLPGDCRNIQAFGLVLRRVIANYISTPDAVLPRLLTRVPPERDGGNVGRPRRYTPEFEEQTAKKAVDSTLTIAQVTRPGCRVCESGHVICSGLALL